MLTGGRASWQQRVRDAMDVFFRRAPRKKPRRSPPATHELATTRPPHHPVRRPRPQVIAGDGVSAVLDASGQLFTWGRMTHRAMLALGDSCSRFGVRQPTRVGALAAQGVTIAGASFGSQHAGAIVGIPRSL